MFEKVFANLYQRSGAKYGATYYGLAIEALTRAFRCATFPLPGKKVETRCGLDNVGRNETFKTRTRLTHKLDIMAI